MQPFRLKMRKIISYSVILALALYAGFVLATEWPISRKALEPHVRGFGKTGLIVGVVGGFWTYYDRRGWRQKPFRLLGLSAAPDLRGRWEGTVRREGRGEEEHPFVLEISQTATRVQVAGFSEHSRSRSIAAQVLYDQSEEHICLIETWEGKTTGSIKGQKSGKFQGATIFTLSFDDRLEGEYFTDRMPTQTRGKLRLERTGKKIKGHF